MRFGSRRIRIMGGAIGTAAVWLLSVALVGGQAGPAAPNAAQSQLLAENVFKNITVLRGIPVDEFMGTMGVFSAALGLSCENCHTASSNNWALYGIDTPRKETARRMVRMMADINKQHFGGRQVVTCFTCHQGSSGQPRVTSSLTLLEVLVVPFRAGNLALAERYEAYLSRSQRVRLMDIGRSQLRMAAQLRALHPSVRTPDALQLATALSAGCRTFVTNDRDLPAVPGLAVLQLRNYL